ncbi:TolC family protein [Nibricoccus sp. IMCC34717]|uniref:TolC family protein n=1 Tax=Nibricoccus sp. IMCC34717 TaxID=3034021 RepID=UPI00384C3385
MRFPLSITLALSFATLGFADETLTLPLAIRQALAKNQSVAISRLDREIATANVTTARGLFDPTLNFRRTQGSDETPLLPGGTGAARWQDDHSVSISGYTPWGASYSVAGATASYRGPGYSSQGQTGANASLSVTQPLLRGFGFTNGFERLRIAKADKRIADWLFQLQIIDTITAVVTSYNDVLEARELLRITEGYRDAVRQLSNDHERRLRIGALAEADVANAQSRAAQIEESVHFSRQAVRDAEAKLLRLIGEGVTAATTPALEPLPMPEARKPDVAADVPRSLALRPDVLATRQGLVKAKTIQSARRMDLLPRVDFVATVGYGDLDTTFARARDTVLDRENKFYSAGVVVSVPLTQAEARGKARAAKAALRQSEEQIASIEADVALAIDRYARFLETAAARVATLEEAEKLAKRSLEAEDKRFRAGTGNTFFVLQQQSELAVVQGNLARARADLRRANALYDRETMRTLERYGVTIE